jgi:hypothetical protein
VLFPTPTEIAGFALRSSVRFQGESGTSQGDPCAPFAFALVLPKLLERMGTLNLQTNFNAWYLDDGKIIAKHAVLRQALDFIHSQGPALGLVLNLSKCTVWWPTPKNAEPAQYNSDIHRVALGGIKFLGSPLGSAEFADDLLRIRFSKIEGLMCQRQTFPDAQVAYILPRHCISLPKFRFSLRTCPSLIIMGAIAKFDLALRETLSMMLGVELTDDEFTQAAAPVPLMGLGLTRAHDVAGISFVTSVHASSGLQAKILQHDYPDPGPFQFRHTAIEKQLIIDLDRTIDDEFLTQALNNHRTASVILSTKVHEIQKEKLL